MLLLYVDYNWMYVAKIVILFCGMFLNNHVCESSETKENCTLKNVLFVSHKKPQSHVSYPSDVVYNKLNGSKLCFNILSNRTHEDCCSNSTIFNCSTEIQLRKGSEYIVTHEEVLSKQAVVLVTVPEDNFHCLPSMLYRKTADFLFNIHKCLDNINNTNKNVRLSKDACGTDPSYDDELCRGYSKYTLIFDAGTSRCFYRCKTPGTNPGTSVNVTGSNGGTTLEKAADIMNSLSSLLDQMGNHSTASISMNNIKGVITKLSKQNPASIYFGFTASGPKIVGEVEQLMVFPRSVKIPKEASEMAAKGNGSFAGVLFFSGMQQNESDSYFFNNETVGIEMGAKISNLSQTIDIRYAKVDKKGYTASCRSWDGQGDKIVWVTDGCKTVETKDSITCQCSHLTFFAVLLSPPPTNISASDVKSLSYITSIGCGLSSFFLAVALFMHFLMRKGKASQGTKILMNLFIAMFALNVCFLINESVANLDNFAACMVMGAALHYSMLATFTWFFMQALHLYFNLLKLSADVKHYMMKICITGWVTPAVVVILLLAFEKYDTLVINTADGKSEKMCWISDAALHQGLNIGYYAVVFAFTFGIFIVTVRQMAVFTSAKEKVQDHSTTKMNYYSILGLFFLLGITWAFAFFSHGPLLIPSYYIFTILNTFQGFFLFIYYYRSSKIVRGNTNVEHTSKSASNLYTVSPYS